MSDKKRKSGNPGEDPPVPLAHSWFDRFLAALLAFPAYARPYAMIVASAYLAAYYTHETLICLGAGVAFALIFAVWSARLPSAP